MEKLLKFKITNKITRIISLLILLILPIISCSKKEIPKSLSFENLHFQLNKEIYFTVKKGIYDNKNINFENMKIYFPNGNTNINKGTINLQTLIIKNNEELKIYYQELIITIKENPIINLKEAYIEGYNVIIQNTKKKENISNAYKIKIDIKKNKVYTYKNKGIL